MTPYEVKTEHPWQNGPTELIAHGLEHMHQNTDFDYRIAFLLFDVGIETLFKTVLLLPDKVTGAKTGYRDRKKAADGNFHELIQGLERARPDIAKKYNLTHIQFFHDTRNKLYHEGNGITVDVGKVNDYAKRAVNLLKDLLEIDLHDLLYAPEKLRELAKQQEVERQTFEDKKALLSKSHTKLAETARSAVEVFAPSLATNVFLRNLIKRSSESPETADEFLTQSINAAISNEQTKRELSFSPGMEWVIRDPGILYIALTSAELGIETIFSEYTWAGIDPKSLVSTPEPVEADDGNVYFVVTMTEDEIIRAAIVWLEERIIAVEQQIDFIETWLDKQNT